MYKVKNNIAIRRAIRLNRLLGLMTRTGKPFPIPVSDTGLELFYKPRPNGLILCSTHIPLSKVALRLLIEKGINPTLALAADPGPTNSIAVWGITKKIPAICTGSLVLLKAKTVLQQGGSIVVLVDEELGGSYSPNVFNLAEKINADIVFFDVILQQDSVVKVNFRESNWNGCQHTDRVQKQLEELYKYMAPVLKGYDNSDYFTAPC